MTETVCDVKESESCTNSNLTMSEIYRNMYNEIMFYIISRIWLKQDNME